MASTKSSRVNPKYKKKYRVGNWPAYERGLRARGDVTIWLTDEALRSWTPPPTRCRGGPQRYSNVAIVTALTLRMLFHLPLRQTEGFLASLLRLMDLNLNAPDHTTRSRRNRDLRIPAQPPDFGRGSLVPSGDVNETSLRLKARGFDQPRRGGEGRGGDTNLPLSRLDSDDGLRSLEEVRRARVGRAIPRPDQETHSASLRGGPVIGQRLGSLTQLSFPWLRWPRSRRRQPHAPR